MHFRKVLIADERYESAGVFDVDNNGILDIVSGAWWYEGPDFKKRHPVGTVAAYDEYYDDFSTIPLDINGDGWTDFITGGWWGNTLRWRENPRDRTKGWPEHIIAEIGNIETTRAWDIDGDGELEIVPNTPNGPLHVFKLIKDSCGKGTGKFTQHILFNQPQGHGLGAGDIAGNGRCDIVLNHGWLEAPALPYEEPWIWHPEFTLSPSASIPILVADINKDGLAELIVGAGHDYGLFWLQQYSADGGQRTWVTHSIDPENSQYHDMMWVDIDGDGEQELLTGKRYRAHCGNDPGAFDPYGIYYFKWDGTHFIKQVIEYGPLRNSKGLGIHFAVADLTGNGLPDIIAPGKDGLCIFYNEGRK